MRFAGRLDRLEQSLAPGDRHIPFDARVRARHGRRRVDLSRLSDEDLDWLAEVAERTGAARTNAWDLDALTVEELERMREISVKLDAPEW